MTKRKKLLLIFSGTILAVIVIYFIFHGWVIAYTDDAYIRAHIMVVSPRVEGHIQDIFIKDNQYVEKGLLLMQLDPYPYQLKLNVEKSALKQQKTQLMILKSRFRTAAEKLKAIQNEYNLTVINYNRYKKLVGDGAESEKAFEEKTKALDEAKNLQTEAQEQCEYWEDMINAQEVAIDAISSKVALAKYNLDQTKIYAPDDGFVANFNVRPGDFAAQGESMFVIIQDNFWWVMANYKESVLRHIKEGQTVWIYCDMYPFRLFKGEVQFIGRGTSRSPNKQKPLPYIKPTTDWIRLQRRFSVRIKFDDFPKDIKLCEGANARTFIVL